MITKEQVKNALTENALTDDTGKMTSATDKEIEAALADIDQEVIRDRKRQELTVEKWDKSSPINGCSATEILNKRNIPGEAYLIKRGDKVVYFQTTKPHVGGNKPIKDAGKEGKAHADELAERAADGEVLRRIKDTLPQI